MPRTKLSDQEISQRLAKLKSWKLAGEKLKLELKFKDFRQAFGFMTKAALISEKLDHHPNWYNAYNTVIIELYTHDAGGLTEMDFKWAEEIELI